MAEACARDEAFHLGVARLSGNAVLLGQLERINERIRYVRWVSMSMGKIRKSKDEHVQVMQALLNRNAELAEDLLGEHISKRMDEVIDVVRHGISTIYMDSVDDLSGMVLTEGAA